MTRWSRSYGPILVAALGLAGCGSSDDAPQQGDNPVAANARSSTEMGDQAGARTRSAPQRGGTKLRTAGE